MASRKQSNVPLYIRIAEAFTRQVVTGVLRPGDRVPSLRKLSREQGVSLSTALQAYVWLENRGYLEARPQSGFYIRTPFAKLIPEPQAESLQSQPSAMGTDAVLEEAIRSANDPAFVPFGAGCARCVSLDQPIGVVHGVDYRRPLEHGLPEPVQSAAKFNGSLPGSLRGNCRHENSRLVGG
jgi:DNA-binding transcriptional regulator YhcF (GntR family)